MQRHCMADGASARNRPTPPQPPPQLLLLQHRETNINPSSEHRKHHVLIDAIVELLTGNPQAIASTMP